MTVRILTPDQKAAIVTIYTSEIRPSSIRHMASMLGVSARTVARVIEQAGAKQVKETMTASSSRVMTLLYEHKITVDQLETMLNRIPPSTVQLLSQTTRRTTLHA